MILEKALSLTPRHVDIQLSEADLAFISEFAAKMIAKKMEESHIKKDHGELMKRQITGKAGELAVERWLKTPFLDVSIGRSKDYAIPDLRPAGYEMGCKTVEVGKAPLVPKEPKIPELIMLWDKNARIVHILGIATPKVLKAYGDDSLVLSRNVRALGYKTGFEAYDKLEPPTQFWMDRFRTK